MIHLQTLIMSYAIILAFCALMAVIMHRTQRQRLTLYNIWYWVIIMISFVFQGAAGTSPEYATLALCVNYLTGFVISLLLSEIYDSRRFRSGYHWLFWGAVIVSVLLYFLGYSFTIYSLPIAWTIAALFLLAVYEAYKSSANNLEQSHLLLVGVTISGLHLLDYPFLRLDESLALVGFGIAFINGIIMAILIPVTINERTNKNFQRQLETEIKVATADLSDKNIRLDRARDENANLVRVLAHDMVNSIAVFKGTQYLINRKLGQSNLDKPLKDEMSSLCERAMASIDMQVSLIDNVRHLQHLSQDDSLLTLGRVDLCKCIDISLDIFLTSIELKRLKIIKKLQMNATVFADEVLLINCLINNLLSNAIKFSFIGNEITISVRLEEKDTFFSVRDNGVGISPAKIKQILSGNTADSSTGTEGEKGTGFGMAIVNNIVRKFNATISVHSKTIENSPDDHGTEFIIRFPTAAIEQLASSPVSNFKI